MKPGCLADNSHPLLQLIRNVAVAFPYANFGMALAFGIVKKGVAMTNKDDRSDTSDLE